MIVFREERFRKRGGLRLRRLMCGRSLTFRKYSRYLWATPISLRGLAPKSVASFGRSQTFRTSGGRAGRAISQFHRLTNSQFPSAQTTCVNSRPARMNFLRNALILAFSKGSGNGVTGRSIAGYFEQHFLAEC